jgi:transposase
MSQIGQQYPALFNVNLAVAAVGEDASISVLASKDGVHATVIHWWKKEALVSMETGFAEKLEAQQVDHHAEMKALHKPVLSLDLNHPGILSVVRLPMKLEYVEVDKVL